MIKFSKVPYSEFRKSAKKCGFEEDDIEKAYKNIKLPTRATKNSAGYDFYFPFDINVDSYKDKYIPTGIRCEMDDDVFLMLVPKSGLGCKYGMSMQNTIGIIDSDYFNAENYGHIHAMINTKHKLCLVHGQKFMQGIFVNYLKTDDDTATGGRTGGFGSTGEFDKL